MVMRPPEFGYKIRYEDLWRIYDLMDRFPELKFGLRFVNFERYPDRRIRFRVVDWGLYRVFARTRIKPEGDYYAVLRAWLHPAFVTRGVEYLDFMQKTLIWRILAYLTRPNYRNLVFTITQISPPPRPDFTIEVERVLM